MVRGLIQTILGQQGYQVLAAGNAVQALQVCRGHDGPIHLLVTDVVMPHLSGRQLAERLAPIYPEMKILYLSGHTEDAIVRHGVSEAEIPFLQKPFPSEDLIRKVQESLAAETPPR
jgi:CheY-like chemotaxis protein